ncbi:helix-turn-helix domain-containing protein [Aquabacterium sp.]|uniref:helix-turn-helix domain-containing protein n=1 Tax=Aquabacterium sp. TaxID=1872578 RepID=UPI0026325602|nr:helix-turn-helix domain-containing protein [Aquabacterium sp.]MDD2978296.1 helix-turn-helix domain-containing protein [Aquabacterium sp.]
MDSQSIVETAAAAVRMYAESHPRPSHVNFGQAAEMMGLSRPTLRKLIESGSIRLNACGLIPISEIDRALAAR